MDPRAQDNYVIRLASENGNMDVVDRLLQDERVGPTAVDNYAMSILVLCLLIFGGTMQTLTEQKNY